jgi:hypothetical protein
LHAGNLTNRGTFDELQAQLSWLKLLPHAHIVVISGNHELLLDLVFLARFPKRSIEEEGASRTDLTWGRITHRHNGSTTLQLPGSNDGHRKLTVWGAPLTQEFGTWAFQFPPTRAVWTAALRRRHPADARPAGRPPRPSTGRGTAFLLRELWRGRGREQLAWDGMQAAYDGVVLRDEGFFAVLGTAVRVAFRWGTGERVKSRTTLVNAVVVGGVGNVESHPAVAVELKDVADFRHTE